jgi:chemotaxis protein methyltransferase CheR
VNGGERPLDRLARLIEEVSGIVVAESHLPFLDGIAAERARACGVTGVARYVAALADGSLAGEWAHLLPRITVNESYFFRTPQHFRALRASVIPALVRVRAGERRLRVWSAGCARGEEPGTVAIVLTESEALAGWEWTVLATDVDEMALAEARAGDYGVRAVEGVPGNLRKRYFAPHGDNFVFDAALRRRIDYRSLNLIHEPFDAPDPPFDLIFLRNVLIYFRPESQRRVAANMARSLAPDGYLFLGPSETLWQLSDQFEPEDMGDCFCYRLRRPERGPAMGFATSRTMRPASDRPVVSVTRAGTALRRTSATAGRRYATAPSPSTDPAPDPRRRCEVVAAALASGDLVSAAAEIRAGLGASPGDTELRALEGLVHDLAGRPAEAAASYRAALFLEPGLFQIRLLLADALRRLGWQHRALHEYREVLATLAGGRGRGLDLTDLALPDQTTAQQRCRAVLSLC